jgi:glycerol-3-phosphate dehydrogenase
MNRDDMLQKAAVRTGPWDLLVIGGGATGAGLALDAAARGYAVLLFEQADFGKGTSSRSTKLVHGGVRYLEQGNVALVMEALKERGLLRRNAPHLVHDLEFVVPSYAWWEGPFYGIGLKLYQMLSGRYGFGASRTLSREETLRRIPNVNPEGLTGGVVYHDGQFDDARLLVNLVQTAAEQGAVLVNYARVTGLLKDADGMVRGVAWENVETGERMEARTKVMVNATGPFTDTVRRFGDATAKNLIAPSQGAHLVLDRSFLPGDTAILVPHTRDGRVMFAIPWHGHTLIGTTDTPVAAAALEPVAQDEEIDFMLETAAHYLERKPVRADIRSVFAGVRPLVRAGEGSNTAALSRDHTIHLDPNGLLSIAGGKWTTYRNMAQDGVDQAATLGGLADRPCVTQTLPIHGHHDGAADFGLLACYGSDAPALRELMAAHPALAQALDPDLPQVGAEVVWAARHEMARTVEDVLARRTRALFLNAKAALRMAPEVARLLAEELGRDEAWQAGQVREFAEVARGFQVGAEGEFNRKP